MVLPLLFSVLVGCQDGLTSPSTDLPESESFKPATTSQLKFTDDSGTDRRGGGASPGAVDDLEVSAVTASGVELTFTAIDGGKGSPAVYSVKFSGMPFSWNSAGSVGQGSCAGLLVGEEVGAPISCEVLGLDSGTEYGFQLAAIREGNGNSADWARLSNVATAKTLSDDPPADDPLADDPPADDPPADDPPADDPPADDPPADDPPADDPPADDPPADDPPAEDPGTVTDLAVFTSGEDWIEVGFTEVDDGAGLPAKYDVRFAKDAKDKISWNSAQSVEVGSCRTVLEGTIIGLKRRCKVRGLQSSRTYAVQLVAFRGTMGEDAVYGSLSNVAAGETTQPAEDPQADDPPADNQPTSDLWLGYSLTGSDGMATGTLKPLDGATVDADSIWVRLVDPNQEVVPQLNFYVDTEFANVENYHTWDMWSRIAFEPGTYTVRAEWAQTSLSATFEVQSSSSPPPQEDPPQEDPQQEDRPGGKEPSGFDVITSRSFDSDEEDGWWNASSGNFEIREDASAPYSSARVGISRFPGGMAGGSTNGTMTGKVFSDRVVRELYISFWIKLSDNWQGHESGVNKIIFIGANGRPGRPAYLSAQGINSGTLRPQVNLQGTPVGGRNLYPNGSANSISRGKWHRWELLLVMNTAGNPDGEAHWWIDGKRAGEYYDVSFVGADDQHWWDELQWRPVWGGTGDQIEAEQSQSIDHFYISGKQ